MWVTLNTYFFLLWNMKEWNVRYFNINSEKITVTVKVFYKDAKRLQKSQQYYFVWYMKNFSDIFLQFPIISKDFSKTTEDSWGLTKISEDYRNCPYTAEDIRRLEYCCA